jgi:beta-N-acetylhexosaminidase
MASNSSLAELSRNAGQLLIMGFDGTAVSPRLEKLLRRLQPGGVILFARNIVSPRQTHQLLADCQKIVTAPLFRCVDMEGGLVDRLKTAIAPAPSAAEVFATGARTLFRKHGRIIGEECHALGFNVDFAPVSDLAFKASQPVMRSRAVSADPKETIGYVREFLRGLKDAGMLGCGKHFPGLGEGKLDSHHDLPTIEKPWRRLLAEDLAPYRLLRREYPFVMVSHAAYPAVAGDKVPASLSKKWITGVLRGKIGYRGLIASDDLEMGAVLAAAPVEQASVETIRAGADIFLICHKEEFVTRSFEAVIKEAERDRKFAARIAESAKRVAAFKRMHLARKRFVPAPSVPKIEKLTRQLWEFAENVRLKTIQRQEIA